MKPLIPILVVATTSLAVASVQFARQAATERARADTEMALRQKSEARVAELERAQHSVIADSGAGDDAPLAATLDTRPPPGMGNRGKGLPEREARVALSSDPALPPPRELGNRVPRMMDSPAARKFMQSRAKSSLRRLYEDVGAAVGLSADKSRSAHRAARRTTDAQHGSSAAARRRANHAAVFRRSAEEEFGRSRCAHRSGQDGRMGVLSERRCRSGRSSTRCASSWMVLAFP